MVTRSAKSGCFGHDSDRWRHRCQPVLGQRMAVMVAFDVRVNARPAPTGRTRSRSPAKLGGRLLDRSSRHASAGAGRVACSLRDPDAGAGHAESARRGRGTRMDRLRKPGIRPARRERPGPRRAPPMADCGIRHDRRCQRPVLRPGLSLWTRLARPVRRPLHPRPGQWRRPPVACHRRRGDHRAVHHLAHRGCRCRAWEAIGWALLPDRGIGHERGARRIGAVSRLSIAAEAEERSGAGRTAPEEEARLRVDAERLRIAREVHDTVAHAIAIINVQPGFTAHVLDKRPERARRRGSRSSSHELPGAEGDAGDPRRPSGA